MMDGRPQLGQRLDALYVAVRDSAAVDRQVAFEVAMSELEYRPLHALVAVAEQARQAIMESLGYQSTGRVWPACPVHGAGTSPEARHGTGVWWCDGGDGHVAAGIGRWSDIS